MVRIWSGKRETKLRSDEGKRGCMAGQLGGCCFASSAAVALGAVDALLFFVCLDLEGMGVFCQVLVIKGD